MFTSGGVHSTGLTEGQAKKKAQCRKSGSFFWRRRERGLQFCLYYTRNASNLVTKCQTSMAAPGAGGFVIEEPGSPSPDYAAKVSAAREQRLAEDLEAVRLSSERARQAEREAIQAHIPLNPHLLTAKRASVNPTHGVRPPPANLNPRALSPIELAVAQAESTYSRLIGDDCDSDQPFDAMIEENPADIYLAQRHAGIDTGSGVKVVLDAANIGYSTNQSSDPEQPALKPVFNVAALQLAVSFFQDAGVDVIAFLPAAHVRVCLCRSPALSLFRSRTLALTSQPLTTHNRYAKGRARRAKEKMQRCRRTTGRY